MEKQTMSLHRALSELKLISSKIEKKTNHLAPIACYVKESPIIAGVEKDKFEALAKEDFQAIEDLYKRRSKIKNALVLKNATTTVTIGERNMTIAEAITEKSYVHQKKQFVEYLRVMKNRANETMEKRKVEVENKAIELASKALSRDVKLSDDEADSIITPFIKKHEFHLCDPLDLTSKIKILSDEIEEFESEVDSVLSEINATTFIEI